MKKVWKSMDYSLLLPLVILCVLGVIMVYSASSILAITKFAKLDLPSNYFFRKQLQALIMGGISLSFVMFIPFQVWRKRIVTVGICVGSIILLVLVLWLGTTANNAQAWVFGIQPVEFVKVGVIIVLARFFAKRQDTDTPVWHGSGGTVLFLLITLCLIYKQPDLGSALLIVGTVGIMFLCSGIRVDLWFKRIVLTSLIWGPLLFFIGKYGLTNIQKARFATFIDPFADPQGEGFQLINSFIGIASGGLDGRGLGNSIQKYGYLPEPHTDFIMTIISEELGFIGVAIILACLLLIVIRSFRIAQKCENPFGSLVAIGIGSMIGVQTFVNLGGITGLLPLTGVPLPFISSGGSSLLANLIAMGILLNLGSYVKRQEKQQEQLNEKKQQGERHLVVVK
ncbi:FtsW/RodA/SpoVE family cell cycle protein [Bacillus sp. DX1.1]|uniref:FtsW/RodA/SpoVE family cell cycle protein n=1 Tax=unclassified Bacillus (in: firmicutes) TaxID=185979 RepID=UPI0025701786|nr:MULTISPECIES: FtsW/RodA/SpoVE family cell cycle protein [unclassified Bacillus (in: firmicutes)]MDM5156133.1 FtsW/RodA/SpoVE family cell cycle protein [Bacillus sp. DX1.1]WJE80417.1 FtsW/RodA/SpoVE family cell cycle protein [Bacillus sp. DX3.1]